MTRLFYLSVLAGLLFASGSMNAQTPVLFRQTETLTYIVHYDQEAASRNSVSNQLIRELARGNNQRLERTEYSYRFQYEVQLTRRQNRLVANIDLRNFRFHGDSRYMGFDMSDVLMPDQVEFTARVQQGNKLVAEMAQRPVNVNEERNRYTLEFADSLANDNNLKVLVPEFVFHFTNHTRNNFNNKIGLIQEYFASDASMQNMYAVLQSLDMYQLERLNENQQHMAQIHSGIAQLHSRDFMNVLRLQDYDPIAMLPKLNEIMVLHQQQSQNLAYVMENLHVLYFERGLELASSNPARARDNFYASLQANSGFAPSVVEMAKSFFYNDRNTPEAISWIKRAYQISYRDDQANRELQQLSRDVDEQLINNALVAERQNQFQQAIAAWQQAQDFCRTIPSVNCSDQIANGMSRSHTGIYNEIFNNASRVSRQGNLQQAEQLAKDAIGYQRTNSQYVASSANAMSLLNDVKNRQYKNFVEQGRRDLGQQRYRNALEAFENAKGIEQEFSVDTERQLPNLLRQAKRPLLLADMESANAAIQRNQLPQARTIIDGVMADINHFDFSADRELTTRLDNIRGQLQSQHCTNIQQQLETMLNRANQQITEGNFLRAEDWFTDIRNLNNSNADCGLSIQDMERRRAEVLPAITWQKSILEVQQQIQTKRYGAAVDQYNNAGIQFAQQGVDKFRMEHKSLAEFSKAHHPDFVLHVSGVYANAGEGLTALNLIYHLETLNYPPKQMRALQESTGIALARADAAINPSWKPKQKVKEYTFGRRNLRYIKNAYVKQFKRSR